MENRVGEKPRSERSEREKIVIYGVIALVLVALAIAFTFSIPHGGSGLARCNQIILGQDKYSCLFSLAVSSQNASVCSYIKDSSQNACYMEVAVETLKPGTCVEAPDQAYVYDCVEAIANRTDSYAACSYLKANDYGSCIELLAIKLDNATACSSIPNAAQSDVCSSAVYIGLAKSEENQSYCGLVYNTTNRTLVSQMVSISIEKGANSTSELASLGQTSFLEGGAFSYSSRDYCYLSVATSSGSNSSCTEISNSTIRSLCNAYSYKSAPGASNTVANATSLSSICGSYTGQNLTACEELASISEAVSSRNATFCSQMASVSAEYQCYASLARVYNDTAYCGYISNATANEACIQDIYYNVT